MSGRDARMIVTVSTIKDTVPNVEKFVRRNLNGGVDHLIVFLDEHQPEIEELLVGSPHVTCIPTHRDWWNDGDRPGLIRRQCVNATLAARMLSRFAWAEWAVHIDGDEVIHVDQAALRALASDAHAVRLMTQEAVAELHPNRDPTWFKVRQDDKNLIELAKRGLIEKPHNSAFFRGHLQGKIGVRPAQDIYLLVHDAFDADGTKITAVARSTWTLLHYESPSVEEFVRKWRSLLAAGGPLYQRPERWAIRREVERLLSAGLSADELDAALSELYQRRIADDVEALRSIGALQELDPDAWTSTPEPIPLTDRDAWADAVAEVSRAPKSLDLPGRLGGGQR